MKDIIEIKWDGKKALEANMVPSWQRSWRNEAQNWSAAKMHMLPPTDTKNLITTPIIVEAEIEGCMFYNIYIDEGAATEIMYERCFF